jgi:hypothetical protein
LSDGFILPPSMLDNQVKSSLVLRQRCVRHSHRTILGLE